MAEWSAVEQVVEGMFRVREKYRGMVEMLSRADPCSSGRMITGRYNVGYMWELSVGTEQILFILQLPRLCEPITEAQCF